MPKLPQYNSTKLFHTLAREAKDDWIKKEGRKPTRDEWNQIQKWTSKNLYKNFKGRSYRRIPLVEIKEEIFIRSTTKEGKKCGNVFEVNEESYTQVDWWDIYNSIAGLPKDIQIRVNAGEFGVTGIQQVAFVEYDGEVNDIVEMLREHTGNKSSATYFEGKLKVTPSGKDDGKPCSYFIDYVLFLDDVPIADDTEIDRPVDVEQEEETTRKRRLKEADRKARQRKIDRVKKAKKRKLPKAVKPPVKKKKKKGKKKKGRVVKMPEARNRVAEMREAKEFYKEGLIDKKTLRELLLEIAKKKDGGIV